MACKSSMSFLSITTLTYLFLCLAEPASAFFRMGGKVIVSARMDPVVSPGAVSQHMHNVVGGSAFSQNYDYATQRSSTCTSVDISVDKSAYWAPGLYYVNTSDSTFTRIPSYFVIYYLDRPNPSDKNKTVTQWPAGLRMVGGNPNRRSYGNTIADKAISFVCLDYSGKLSGRENQFFKHNCPNGMRAQVVFPSCWDGTNLDSVDHKSHMSYPLGDNPDSGECPSTHPVRLITLFYEQIFSVQDFPYNGDGTWALANGDVTGYGFHGDFVNGWDDSKNSVLQQAMDTCHNASGEISDCPVLVPYIDTESKESCKYNGEIPDEDTGFRAAGGKGKVAKMPGCNPLWSGSGSKPTCDNSSTTPTFVPPKLSVIPSGWSELGCYTEGSGGRALRGANLVDAQAMTKQKCISFCASKGFKISGVEWSQECYCDNELRGNSVLADQKKCSMTCSGNFDEYCGGSSHLTVFTLTSSSAATTIQTSTTHSTSKTSSQVISSQTPAASLPNSTTPSITSTSTVPIASTTAPSGWSYKGCVAEPRGERALKGSSFADDSMTIEKCTAHCKSKGFLLAGVEYARECFCDDSFQNGAGELVTENQCAKPCVGNAKQICGGSSLLSVYQLTTLDDTVLKLTTGWTEVGCVSEPLSGRLLSGALINKEEMTPKSCTDFCASRGFSIAGIEWTRECYCGNNLSTGKTAKDSVVDAAKCKYKCPGAPFSKCGGDLFLNIFTTNLTKRRHRSKSLKRVGI